MAEIKTNKLFSKLSPTAYKALEAAAKGCKMAGNPYVELIHWVDQLLRDVRSDVALAARAAGIRIETLAKDIQEAFDELPRGATSISSFSPHLPQALEQGFLWSAVHFSAPKIRSGHLLIGILSTPELQRVLERISAEFEKLDADSLVADFESITQNSNENASSGEPTGGGAVPGQASGAIAPAEMGRQEALSRFTVDLTERARKGEIDAVVGRDDEIRQCVDALMRRRQNNPILTGEAGVGKTAVVEGLAHRILAGDVPPALKDVSIRSLDIGLLQAGASMKGEFEQRLRSVIDEVQASPKPIILFIDEAHTLIGAGGQAGTGDAANLLKPALARGTLRTIAATTWDEYKRHFEKDPALTRRFQVVKVPEPSEKVCIEMMRAVLAPFEKHHRVQILDEAIESAVRLSHRYIPSRQLPDKAVSLIDTACARVAVSQHAVPPRIDDQRRLIAALEAEARIVQREQATGSDHAARAAEIAAKIAEKRESLKTLEAHWAKEKALVDQVLSLRSTLRQAGSEVDGPAPTGPDPSARPAVPLSPEDREAKLAELKTAQTALKALQGEDPLMFPTVDAGAIGAVVADWTGIPVGRMMRSEVEQVLKLADILEKRVIGQRHALDMIARRVRTNRAQLDNPNRPVGVFMLAGPSGTGKTETALTLAEALYGGEQNMISINMSEFQEAHTVSTLKGSPPGYVGYGEGGILTEAVRRRPYSVVLLDEVEKAHSDVHEIFFQVFDKGWMEDAEGRYIDFKNTLIILTSNAAQDVVINLCKDPELMPNAEGLEKAMRGPLTKVFPDALLNRLVVVPYYPISRDMLRRIIELNLAKVSKRVEANHKVPFTFSPEVLDLIAQRCSELERGARMVDAMITNTLLPEIGQEFLSRLSDGRAVTRVHIDVADGDFKYLFD